MFGSKLEVSESTRVYKDLTTREKGKIRWERLKEADLTNASTRKDIAMLGGYDRDDVKGASWVNNLVARGYLAEIFEHKEGQMRYNRYALTGKEPFHRKVKRKRTVIPTEIKEIIKPISSSAEVVIARGDMTITLKMGDRQVIDLITSILK